MAGSKRRRIVSIALICSSLSAAACFRTNLLVRAFNSGALDTSVGDPLHDPDEAAIELVAARIRQELGDGYFGQGPAPSQYVASWMENLAGESHTFARLVADLACLDDVRIGTVCTRPIDAGAGEASPGQELAAAGMAARARAGQLTQTRGALRGMALTARRPDVVPLRACVDGKRDDDVVARFSDSVRFESALERAARACAALVGEGLVNDAHVQKGAKRAFMEAARYVRDRGWRREFDRPTRALVVKGGASTGVFSAGGAWAVLNLINECMADKQCNDAGVKDFRFEMMSGTSTGALVATVVDLYNAESTYQGRKSKMRDLASWFTCSAMNDLYCVRSAPVLDLAQSQDSLLEFDGLTDKLRKAVTCAQMTNSSELILNTVDFRSGRLYALSDQERFSLRSREDIVQGALASAVLPFIARPVYRLPTNYNATVPHAYLDGGIRSEIPIMPVVRRGAERVLVIGSSSSIPGEAAQLRNAAGIAARYVDVSVDGLIETELAQSQAYAQGIRLAEQDACRDALDSDAHRGICETRSCREAICAGRWSSLCNDEEGAPPAMPKHEPHVTPGLDQRLEAFWKMATIFRDEHRVEPLHGYTFDPHEQRRLFLAGVEAVRVSCFRIARLLGISIPENPDDPMRRKLAGWCSPALEANLCGTTTPASEPPDCKGPIPDPSSDLIADCRPDAGAP